MSVAEVVAVGLYGAEGNPAQSIPPNPRVSDTFFIGPHGEGGCGAPVNLENSLGARLVGNNINV